MGWNPHVLGNQIFFLCLTPTTSEFNIFIYIIGGGKKIPISTDWALKVNELRTEEIA